MNELRTARINFLFQNLVHVPEQNDVTRILIYCRYIDYNIKYAIKNVIFLQFW